MSSAAKDLVSCRFQADVLHYLFDWMRPLPDITKKMGSYHMNDVLHFVETLEPYFFRDSIMQTSGGRARTLRVWPPKMKSLWRKACAALFWFIRPQNAVDITEIACENAIDRLWDFSKDVQMVLGPAACSFNLHQLVCRCADCS